MAKFHHSYFNNAFSYIFSFTVLSVLLGYTPPARAQFDIDIGVDEWIPNAVEAVENVGDAIVRPIEDATDDVQDMIRESPQQAGEFITEIVTDVSNEVDSCFSGGCDPSVHIEEVVVEAESIGEQIENVDWREAYNLYNNPSSAYRQLWGEISALAPDELEGLIDSNFGHVTNKWDLRNELEGQGIVAYGLEISHDEYMQATSYAAASVATENPGPLIYYFEDLATRSYTEMLLSIEQALSEVPDHYAQQYGKIMEALTPEYIATSLAAYVSTGEVPDIAIELGMPEVRFGMLTYSRGEQTPLGVMTTPNTHQPYLLIVPPELNITVAEVEQTIDNYRLPAEEIITAYERNAHSQPRNSPDYDGFYSSLAVTAGFLPDPVYFDTSMGAVSGGEREIICENSVIYVDEPNLPDHVLYFVTQTAIDIFAEIRTPDSPTMLVIVDNDGNVRCGGHGSNPVIGGTWSAGDVVGIWVGDEKIYPNFQTRTWNVPYTLGVTERR